MADKILVPLDGSELAEAVLPYAERVARERGWGVVLLRVIGAGAAHDRPVHVAPIEAPLEQETIPPGGYDALRQDEAAAAESLEAAAGRVRAAGVPVEVEVGVGDPRTVICERAAAGDVILVAMASHGRTGLARIFRGSVATGVVDHTTRPVLVVRPFGDQDARVELEHAERLPTEHVDGVRQAVAAVAG